MHGQADKESFERPLLTQSRDLRKSSVNRLLISTFSRRIVAIRSV